MSERQHEDQEVMFRGRFTFGFSMEDIAGWMTDEAAQCRLLFYDLRRDGGRRGIA